MSTTNFAIFLIGILAIVLVSFGDFGIKHKSKYQILNSSLRMYSKKDAIFKFDKLRYNDKTVYELK
ncbi:hypothetical protein NMF85_09755 [Clostridioides difficile]|uniref:hypothetical protein n=1 Tax=Clostridioides difficile TaxID=1496 RepID=UPI001C1B2E1C|nr:hypothetical protein [Clostridioides difficile]EKJ1811802.1 hypothetical protein [Clostridioides difficile]MBZ0632339.1 hypothetical protein [Clostridioides difficile]MBZ0658197.1 hypothetical protein [Clostridioides difficile]MCP8337803.1 hypothetical protein [Clostridioides difficile]MCP8365838.1 hypothetical protein [Clostridioides difficile]